jgi:hypothetical protein
VPLLQAASQLLPPPDRDRPILEAIEEFGERLRAGGSHGEFDEWSVYDETFSSLLDWAEETGCYFRDLSPLIEGGREQHLLQRNPKTEIRNIGRRTACLQARSEGRV